MYTLKTKLRLYNTLVKSVLLCGCEIWKTKNGIIPSLGDPFSISCQPGEKLWEQNKENWGAKW